MALVRIFKRDHERTGNGAIRTDYRLRTERRTCACRPDRASRSTVSQTREAAEIFAADSRGRKKQDQTSAAETSAFESTNPDQPSVSGRFNASRCSPRSSERWDFSKSSKHYPDKTNRWELPDNLPSGNAQKTFHPVLGSLRFAGR